MSIRRRDLLILAAVWLVGCSVVVVLIAFFYASSVAQEPELPPPIATVTIQTRGNTAKMAYSMALDEAQAWQNDVKLVAISTQWSEASLETLGQAPKWDFRFFSPEHDRIFFAVVGGDDQVSGRAHLYHLRSSPPLIKADWVLDSDEAISIWANNGGGAFLQNFPGSKVELLLRQIPGREGPVWDVLGVSADESQVFYLMIDATSGDIINQ